jgi:hypothetical protein
VRGMGRRKNHNVKSADALRGDILDTKVLIFDATSEETTGGLEAKPVAVLPTVPVWLIALSQVRLNVVSCPL